MKDIHVPIRAMLVNLITIKGFTSYENGAVPDDAPTPYVIISDINAVENSNKSDFGNNVQVLLDVVTSYPKAQVAGSLLADTIAGAIMESYNSKTKIELTENLQIVNTKILQNQKIAITTNTHKIYRRLIRYQHLIMEV